MEKFVFESLEELKEFYYNEPEEGDKVPSEIQDSMYKTGKEGFDPEEHEFGVEEELFDYFLEIITETTNYTDLDRASIEKIFKRAMDIHYQEG